MGPANEHRGPVKGDAGDDDSAKQGAAGRDRPGGRIGTRGSLGGPVPGRVRDVPAADHEVPPAVRQPAGAHYQPAHHGNHARHGHRGHAHARGDPVGADGQHHVLHQSGGRGTRADSLLGDRHGPARQLRAAEPVHDARRPADHHRAHHGQGGAGARGADPVRHRVPLAHPGRHGRHHDRARPADRRAALHPVEVPDRRGRGPQQGRRRPRPALRGARRRRRRDEYHLRGGPVPVRSAPPVGSVLDAAAGRRAPSARASASACCA